MNSTNSSHFFFFNPAAPEFVTIPWISIAMILSEKHTNSVDSSGPVTFPPSGPVSDRVLNTHLATKLIN